MDINSLDFFRLNAKQILEGMVQAGYWRHQLFNKLSQEEVREVEKIAAELNLKSIFQYHNGGNCYVYW